MSNNATADSAPQNAGAQNDPTAGGDGGSGAGGDGGTGGAGGDGGAGDAGAGGGGTAGGGDGGTTNAGGSTGDGGTAGGGASPSGGALPGIAALPGLPGLGALPDLGALPSLGALPDLGALPNLGALPDLGGVLGAAGPALETATTAANDLIGAASSQLGDVGQMLADPVGAVSGVLGTAGLGVPSTGLVDGILGTIGSGPLLDGTALGNGSSGGGLLQGTINPTTSGSGALIETGVADDGRPAQSNSLIDIDGGQAGGGQIASLDVLSPSSSGSVPQIDGNIISAGSDGPKLLDADIFPNDQLPGAGAGGLVTNPGTAVQQTGDMLGGSGGTVDGIVSSLGDGPLVDATAVSDGGSGGLVQVTVNPDTSQALVQAGVADDGGPAQSGNLIDVDSGQGGPIGTANVLTQLDGGHQAEGNIIDVGPGGPVLLEADAFPNDELPGADLANTAGSQLSPDLGTVAGAETAGIPDFMQSSLGGQPLLMV